jgi:hypothetical protein
LDLYSSTGTDRKPLHARKVCRCSRGYDGMPVRRGRHMPVGLLSMTSTIHMHDILQLGLRKVQGCPCCNMVAAARLASALALTVCLCCFAWAVHFHAQLVMQQQLQLLITSPKTPAMYLHPQHCCQTQHNFAPTHSTPLGSVASLAPNHIVSS